MDECVGEGIEEGWYIAHTKHVAPTPEEIQKEIEEISSYKTVDLPDRKLKQEYLEYFGVKIGVSEEDGETPVSHYYPYYKNGELVGYKVRWIDNKKMWGIGQTGDVHPLGWEQAIQVGGKKLFITEGELDAVALFQIFKEHNKGTQYADLNPPIVSLPNGAGGAGKYIAKHLHALQQHFKEIVLVFDTDAPGNDRGVKGFVLRSFVVVFEDLI